MSKHIRKYTKLSSKKQQWSKALSSFHAEKLRKLNPESPLKKSYMNTYNCNSVKVYDGEKMKGSYCKNRWCYTCNRIRTAININNYFPEISKMGQPYFVTLTRPTVSIEELPKQIDKMEHSWRLLYNYSKKKKPKSIGIHLLGVRSMECTLRPDDKYHYHIHLIVDGWANAEWIRREWLKRNPESSGLAQDVRPANKGALMEVFKYAVKMSVKTTKDDDFKRLDKVFQILRGKRTISTFGGFKVPKNIESDEFDEIESQAIEELQLRLGNDESVWIWNYEIYDWINTETGELLIGEPLPKKIEEAVKNE